MGGRQAALGQSNRRARQRLFRPSGARSFSFSDPGLTPGALFLRRFPAVVRIGKLSVSHPVSVRSEFKLRFGLTSEFALRFARRSSSQTQLVKIQSMSSSLR